MTELQREGVLVRPHCRLSQAQIKLIDGVSRDLLENPGLLCYNAAAADVYASAGAKIESEKDCVRTDAAAPVIVGNGVLLSQ